MPGRVARRFARWFDTNRLVGTVLIVALVSGPSYWAQSVNAQNDREQAEQDRIDDGYHDCLVIDAVTDLLAVIVVLAYEPRPPVDFTRVPSFASLDPAMRRYLTDLRDQAAARADPADDPGSTRNRILAELPQRDCEAEFPDRSPGITIDTPPTIIEEDP